MINGHTDKNGESTGFAVLRGRGDGTLSTSSNYAIRADDQWWPFELRDWNNDGILDLGVGDLSGDGVSDLVVPSQDGARTALLLGKGDGSFVAEPELALDMSGLTLFVAFGFVMQYQIALADFDRDGAVEMVAPTPPKYAMTATSNTPGSMFNTASVFHGNGDGTFVMGASYSADASSGNGAGFAVVTADLTATSPDLSIFVLPTVQHSRLSLATSTATAHPISRLLHGTRSATCPATVKATSARSSNSGIWIALSLTIIPPSPTTRPRSQQTSTAKAASTWWWRTRSASGCFSTPAGDVILCVPASPLTASSRAPRARCTSHWP